MKIVTDLKDIRKSVTGSGPVLAAVGATDAAVSVLRSAQADLSARAETLRSDLAPAKVRAGVQNVPNLAISKTLEAAGKAEETYSDLASRGKSLVGAVRRKSATKELLAQGRSTVTLGKAAVTTVRKASDDTLVAAKATITAGRREAAKAVGSAVKEAEVEVKATPAKATAAKKTAKKATANTRSASKRTATTARTRTATAKKATKAVRTSTRKTASATKKATTSAARSVGTTRTR